MAIISIDNLTEIETAGANDFVLVATASGARKIKVSAMGGGGGSSDFEALELTFNNGVISTTKTASEIMALLAAGKCLFGVVNIPAPVNAHIQLVFGMMTINEGTYILTSGFTSMEEWTKIEFTASSADSVMTATLGG